MSGTVAELQSLVGQESLAKRISTLYTEYQNQRRGWLNEKSELRDYIFATDTSTTSNSALPWKNKTTLPKLCSIRDNLHSNYLSALMPNDDWIKWVAHSNDEDMMEKATAIQSYIANKASMGGVRQTMSQLLLDYIDYGNAFVETEWVDSSVKDEDDNDVPHFIGPKLRRISPLDIVFNPTAASFDDSYKIVRYIKTVGELLADAEDRPEDTLMAEAAVKVVNTRQSAGQFRSDYFEKALGFTVDGFGSLQEYYQSGLVEILRFEGDIYDNESDTLHRNREIYIVDRAYVVYNEKIRTWGGKSRIRHVGWRTRPDNLYAMGPLDNLVGMQYRIDHLENLKADVFDFIAHPPIKIIGDVPRFVWKPGAQIHIDGDGDVGLLNLDSAALAADMQINELENKMEEFAGAPRTAMGIRTPGEKTAFEVQQLQTAAGRIFQEKITNFEICLLEPALNDMLLASKRHLNASDVVRVMDDDLGVAKFITITREDITASGVLRPIGARHFAAQAQLVQNLVGMLNGPIGAKLDTHMSGKKLSRMVEDALNLGRFDLFAPNVALFEQQETAQLAQQIQQEMAMDSQTDEGGDLDI